MAPQLSRIIEKTDKEERKAMLHCEHGLLLLKTLIFIFLKRLKTMTSEQTLLERSGSTCELCAATENLSVYEVPGVEEEAVLLCTTCKGQIEAPESIDVHHWRCLNDSMWSQEAAVQIMAWRMLTLLSSKGEGWAQDQLEMLYLEEDVLAKAQSSDSPPDEDDDDAKHVDSNGAVLEAGDTVTLIKDLNVKGGGFTAKRGTAVRNISLVFDNPEHIEGRVSGQQIVILTKYVKKS